LAVLASIAIVPTSEAHEHFNMPNWHGRGWYILKESEADDVARIVRGPYRSREACHTAVFNLGVASTETTTVACDYVRTPAIPIVLPLSPGVAIEPSKL
jgi:hypothetical protein